jgi:hypothetical protein
MTTLPNIILPIASYNNRRFVSFYNFCLHLSQKRASAWFGTPHLGHIFVWLERVGTADMFTGAVGKAGGVWILKKAIAKITQATS